MFRILLITSIFLINNNSLAAILKSEQPAFHTTVNTRNVTQPRATIQFQLLGKPHHLFIGRCGSNDQVLHQENIILNNDGKSHISATIKITVDGPVHISCVKVLDQLPGGQGAYPSYIGGGVGHNYVIIGVTTNYGKGFNFYIQIYGYEIKKGETEKNKLR